MRTQVRASAYSFVVCDQGDCSTSVGCVISNAATTCSDDVDNLGFAPGDSLSVVAFNSAGVPATVDVGWSLDYAYNPSGGCI